MSDQKYKILNKEEKGSKTELEIEVPVSVLESFREDAIRELSKDIQIDGFRKGHAPTKIILEKVGEMSVLEKSAYKTVNNLVPIIISNEKMDVLMMPEISITKIAIGSPLVFKMKAVLFPKIELPDYKNIAKKIEKVEEQKVDQKEIDEYINYIQKQRARAGMIEKSEKIDEEKLELPKFDDEFVKTLGDFKTVDQFKKELEKNMLEQKKQRAFEIRRIKIIEKIIDETKAEIPEILVEEELEKMFSKFKFDIEQFKMKPEDYLREIKKTETDLKNEWKQDALKRVKMNLILPTIAEKEKLKASEEEIKKEIDHIKEHDKNINEHHARIYVSNVLTNEAVFKFLEEQ